MVTTTAAVTAIGLPLRKEVGRLRPAPPPGGLRVVTDSNRSNDRIIFDERVFLPRSSIFSNRFYHDGGIHMLTIIDRSTKPCFVCGTTKKTVQVKFKDKTFSGVLCMEHMYDRMPIEEDEEPVVPEDDMKL